MRHLGKMDWRCLVALLVNLKLRIPKLEPDTTFSNRVPLVSIELEYHAEWCALKSPSHFYQLADNDEPRLIPSTNPH